MCSSTVWNNILIECTEQILFCDVWDVWDFIRCDKRFCPHRPPPLNEVVKSSAVLHNRLLWDKRYICWSSDHVHHLTGQCAQCCFEMSKTVVSYSICKTSRQAGKTKCNVHQQCRALAKSDWNKYIVPANSKTQIVCINFMKRWCLSAHNV